MPRTALPPHAPTAGATRTTILPGKSGGRINLRGGMGPGLCVNVMAVLLPRREHRGGAPPPPPPPALAVAAAEAAAAPSKKEGSPLPYTATRTFGTPGRAARAAARSAAPLAAVAGRLGVAEAAVAAAVATPLGPMPPPAAEKDGARESTKVALAGLRPAAAAVAACRAPACSWQSSICTSLAAGASKAAPCVTCWACMPTPPSLEKELLPSKVSAVGTTRALAGKGAERLGKATSHW